ncbi:MAG: NAD(P)-dependent oxidoreductase [bacterium]|nr:NAD(P)-dependent oxidoreductase [bacterium]
MATILITGATGFLGSRLVELFLSQGHSIVILKRSFSDTWRINAFKKSIRAYDTDQIDMEKVFNENQIDLVIHAATNYGRDNEKNNNSFIDVVNSNLMFPLKLLDLSIQYKVKYFINTDTFMNKFNNPGGNYLNSYRITKKQFLQWLVQYSTNIPVINIRLEHLFGPKDSSTKFVTSMIYSMLTNQAGIDLTPGKQLRDFIFITDAVNAYGHIVRNLGSIRGSYNEFELGTGISYSIEHFLLTIQKLIKSRSKLNFGSLPYRENEIMDSTANLSALEKLGWKPRISIEDGLHKTIEYYRSVYREKKQNEIN